MALVALKRSLTQGPHSSRSLNLNVCNGRSLVLGSNVWPSRRLPKRMPCKEQAELKSIGLLSITLIKSACSTRELSIQDFLVVNRDGSPTSTRGLNLGGDWGDSSGNFHSSTRVYGYCHERKYSDKTQQVMAAS